MKLYNHTSNEVFYGISGGGAGDCGNIDAGQTTDLPAYDNQPSVVVTFSAVPNNPEQAMPFTITIPETNTGMTVTIGLYQE